MTKFDQPMKIRAIAPWFGGKRNMASDIAEQLGRHSQYFEPFCGSMAVLFSKDQVQKETVNDLHGDLINLAVCLQDEFHGPWIYERCQRTLFSEGLVNDAKDYFDESPDWSENDPQIPCRERAYWYFVSSWMSRNGTAGMARISHQAAVRFTKGGGSTTTRWRNAVESIPAWHRRLANVVILQRDAFTLLDKFEDVPETGIYCDPPYVIDRLTRTGVKSAGDKSHSYKHEFGAGEPGSLFDDPVPSDHERLATALRAYKRARIVVSYYDCELIRELYEGWTFIDKTTKKNIQRPSCNEITEAPEVLIVNGEAYQ